MDFNTFWEAKRKICAVHSRCTDGCPLYDCNSYTGCLGSLSSTEKGVPIIEQWLKENGEAVEKPKPKLDAEALAELSVAVGEICADATTCRACPLNTCCISIKSVSAETWRKAIASVEDWHNRDRSKRIRPTECVRVFTLEVTDVRKESEGTAAEVTQAQLNRIGKKIADYIKDICDSDDVICTKSQQFVTKWEEQE